MEITSKNPSNDMKVLGKIKKARTLAIISLVAVLSSVVFELVVPGRRAIQSQESVAERIGMLVSATETSGEEWCSNHLRREVLERLRAMPPLDEWRDNGVSHYLFASDSLVFWNNHIYCDLDFDSIILAGSNGCVEIDSSRVLIFERCDTLGHRAITVVQLSNAATGANPAIFDNAQTKLLQCPEANDFSEHTLSGNLAHFWVGDHHFAALMPLYERESNAMAIVGWIGVFAAIFSLILLLTFHVTNGNVLKQLLFVFLLLLTLRVAEFYVDFPQGGSYSWQSLSSVLISQLMIMFMLIYLYYVRWKVAYRVRRMSLSGRVAIFVVFTVLMCAAILFFHLTMVDIVYQYNITVELYSLFSMSFAGMEFYMICSVFAIYRILYGFILRSVFAGNRPWVNIVVSESVLAIMVFVVGDRMHDSGIYLLTMHLLFMVVASMIAGLPILRIFVINVIILTLYICFFAAGETRSAKLEEAKKYAVQLLEDPQNPPPVVYKNFSYAIVSPNMVVGHAAQMGDLSDLLIFDQSLYRIVVVRDGVISVIHHHQSMTSIVSYRAANLIDLLSLICYIFLGLYMVAGVILVLLGVRVYGSSSIGQLSNKIRYTVAAIVLCSMIIVAWITQAYSQSSHQTHQRELLGTQVKGLLESFSKFVNDNYATPKPSVTTDSVLFDWYSSRGSGFRSDLCLYDMAGSKLIENKIGPPKPTMIDYKAWHASVACQLPYMVLEDGAVLSAYATLFASGRVVGFARVTSSENFYSSDRYALLDNILNLFIILLLFSISLSAGLYSLIAGPLKLLAESMRGVGRLQKIPINRRYSMNDEVGTLIMQYNRMVDYLDETYKNMARTERENTWREMARQVAHEIKNPLTPMRLKIQMLQRARAEGYADLDQRTTETLDLLIEQIDVLSNIATAFSDMARIEQGQTVRMELDSVVGSIVDLYRDNSNSLEIELRFENPVPLFVQASYATLSRLFVNLLQNAMQATLCDGRIVVRLRQEDGLAIVSVADNGRGIEPELLERIFEPNFTTRSSGSGLGLAICRQIVASYRGTITVVSTPGQGSVFTVSLPLEVATARDASLTDFDGLS